MDSTKLESISLGVPNNPSSPSLSNKFEVITQLDEELNWRVVCSTENISIIFL